MPREDVRLLVLCAGDPESERAFSGSARGLISALERRGIVHAKANVLGFFDSFQSKGFLLNAIRTLDRFGMESAYSWSDFAFARNSARARRIAHKHPGFNACFMYGTTYLPELPVPTYCYFDATAAQVHAARAWEFEEFSPATAQRVIHYQQRVFDACTCIFPRTHWAAQSVRNDYGVPASRVLAAGAGPNYLAEPVPHGGYDQQTILFVGIEFERKGGPLVLEAFRRVRAQLPAARLVIVGASPEIHEPGVEVVGKILKDAPGGKERLLKIYSEASVFCMMSHFEPFGIVVIEAQNSYVPCVLPNRFAFPEMIRDGETGCLVKDDTPETLAATLLALLAAPGRLRAMGQAAHDYVRAKWTWDAAAERIHQRIQQDLESRG